jgi:tripartite-type tricarboxylate transporter receptor subunit TctC
MQKISTEAIAIVKEPEVTKQLAVVGVEPRGGGPEKLDRVLKDEFERVGKVVKAAGIRLD